MLKFKDLHIGFISKKSENRLLFSASEFEFQKGDFVAVIGPNGAGKTTLFNTLLGFNSALQGDISFNNEDLRLISREEKVKTLSFVPSKFLGVNNLTVYELVAMGRAPYTNILNQLTDDDKQIVESILKQLNLEELAYKNTLFLSDGERQIAMIGKALAQETDIIILDEPTAFLDYNNRRKVLNILKDIAVKDNKIVFLSSHDLELCFEFCNRIVAIDKKDKDLKDYQTPFDKANIIKEIFE